MSAKQLINPAKLREAIEERDKTLALEYLKQGKGMAAIAALTEKYGVNERMVFRAFKRHREWAEAQLQGEAA